MNPENIYSREKADTEIITILYSVLILNNTFSVSKPSRRLVGNHKSPPERPSRPSAPRANIIIENKDSDSGSDTEQIIVSTPIFDMSVKRHAFSSPETRVRRSSSRNILKKKCIFSVGICRQ